MILPTLTLSIAGVAKMQHTQYFSETKVNVFNRKRNVLPNQRLRLNTKAPIWRNVAITPHCQPIYNMLESDKLDCARATLQCINGYKSKNGVLAEAARWY